MTGSGHDADVEARLASLRAGVRPPTTSVERVMRRGHALRQRSRRRRVLLVASSLSVVAAVGAAALILTPTHDRQTLTVSSVPAGGALSTSPANSAAVPLGGDCAKGVADASSAHSGRPKLAIANSRLTLVATHVATIQNCAIAPVAGLFEFSGTGETAPAALLAVWGPGANAKAPGGPTDSPSFGQGGGESTIIRGASGRAESTPNALELVWHETDGTSWVATSNGLTEVQAVDFLNSLALVPSTGAADLTASSSPRATKISITQQLAAATTATRTVYELTGPQGDIDVTLYENSNHVTGQLLGTLIRLSGLAFPSIHGSVGIAGSNGPATNFVSFPLGPTQVVTVVGALPLPQLQHLAESLTLSP